jgi:hypothetical protein
MLMTDHIAHAPASVDAIDGLCFTIASCTICLQASIPLHGRVSPREAAVQQEWLLILPAVAGIAMGLLYAVSGFRDAGKGTDIKTSPRVTNLRWIATVGAASLIGDWKQLNDGVQISKVSMTGAYLVAVIITAILAIFVIARSLYKNRKQEISQSGTAGNISPRDAAWLM